MARAKRKLPAKPAAFISPQHRSHFCRRHPIPEHKAPAADNTHPTKTSRLGQTAPTDARTQKTRCRSEHRRPFSFLRTTAVTSAAVIRYPNTKPPPPTTIHTPQKPHGPVKRHRPTPEHKKTRCRSEHRRPLSFLRSTAVTSAAVNRLPSAKNPLPLRTPPAGFISPQHRSHFCRRHPIPEHKAPAADDNTHPTKTSRPDQTAPTDARTQKTRCRRQYTPHKNLTARSNGTDRYPNTKKTRCRSEHRRPVLFFRTTAVPPAAVIRYPNTKPPPPTIHTPQKPHGSVKRHRPTPEHKKPAAAPNTAGRFRFL